MHCQGERNIKIHDDIQGINPTHKYRNVLSRCLVMVTHEKNPWYMETFQGVFTERNVETPKNSDNSRFIGLQQSCTLFTGHK